MTLHRQLDLRRLKRTLLGQRQLQRGLHGVLAVAGGKLQNLQVFAGRGLRRMLAKQRVVRHAEVACGEHVGAVLVVLKGSWLADQGVDYMPVVDRVLAVARQPGHRLNLHSRPPHFDLVGVDHDIDLHPDQPAGNRVGVAADLNRAAAVNLDAAYSPPMVELRRRQFAEVCQLLLEFVATASVPLVDQLLEKLLVLDAAGEVAAAAQMQRLVDGCLQVSVRGLHIAVLMRLAGVGPLRLNLVVVHQILVARAKLTVFRKVVDRRAEAVAAVLARRSAQFPDRLLKPAAHGLERFGEADRHEFPIRVREGEVIQQMVEWLSVDRDPQRVHAGEVGCPQVARMMNLREHHVLVRALQPTPVADPPLEGAPLRVGKPAGVAVLQPAKQGERP